MRGVGNTLSHCGDAADGEREKIGVKVASWKSVVGEGDNVDGCGSWLVADGAESGVVTEAE